MIVQEIVGLLIGFVAIPTACFLLLRLFDGFPRIRLMQVAGIVAVAAYAFALVTTRPYQEVPLLLLGAVAILFAFFGAWRAEYRHLMLRRDEDFPGRFDKVGWMIVLTVFAPAGVWLYRSFRMAQWPDKAVAGLAPREEPANPWDEPEEALAGSGRGRVD